MARYTVDVLDDSGQRIGFVPTPLSPSYRRRQNQATPFSFGVLAADDVAPLLTYGRRCILRRDGVERAAGTVTRRDLSGQVTRIECITDEALLRDLITPADWNYWAGWELGDAVRDLLMECVVQARNTPDDWAAAVEKVDVDLATMPGQVVLAKDSTGRYKSHGYITLQFEFGQITKYQVLRWSEDVGEEVRIKAQFRTSSDGLTWGPWSEELQSVFPAEDGVALTGNERYIQVRMHLYTDNTSAKDRNGVPTGYTPVLNGVEVIARRPGPITEGAIEDTAGVTVPSYRSEDEDKRETYYFDRENALRILQTWCEDFGYEFKVDGQRRLYFGKDLGAVKPIVLRRTTNMDIKSLGDSADRLANVLHCYGAGDGPAQIRTTLRNEDSISLYGERIGVFEDSSADTLAKLIESGNKHLAKVSVPEPQFVVHHVPIDELPEDMELYDTVTVVDPKSGVVTEARILDDERTLTTTSEDVSLGLNCTLDNVIERIVKNQAPRPQPGGLPAAAPWNLQAKVGYGYVQLSWSGKATEFVVEHSVDGVSFDVLSRTPYRYYLHTGLQPGSTHYYRVTAVTSGGASAPSVVVPAAVSHVPIEDLDPTPPDTPVWDTCEFTRNIVLRWHAAASAVEYEIREVDDDWGETVGQVWRGSATSATLTPTKRSHTFYIRAISLAGVYSTEAASITLTNDTPSTPPAPLVEAFFGALAITLRPVPDDDIVSYQLYVTPVDEQGTAVGDTEVITYPYAGRVVYQAAPGTRLRLRSPPLTSWARAASRCPSSRRPPRWPTRTYRMASSRSHT